MTFEAEENMIQLKIMLKCKKAEICNRYRPGRSERAPIFGRNTTGKYCGRDADVRCRKKEISLLTERTIIYKKLILPTN